MNDYYFGDNSIDVDGMASFLEHHVFSEFSGVTVACYRDENGTIIGFTTFSMMYPGHTLSRRTRCPGACLVFPLTA